MIKRLASILGVIILFFFSHVIGVEASTIYSNSFTESSDLAEFQNNFGPCTTSASGLTCNNGNVIYKGAISNEKCVSADVNANLTNGEIDMFDSTIGGVNNALLDFDEGGYVSFNNINSYPSSVLTPNGMHNYKICYDHLTNNFTIYLDNALIFTHAFSESSINPDSFYLTLRPGETLTNLLVTDTLPVPTTPTPTPIPDSHLTVPLLKQTSNPWQSQIYDSAKSWAPATPTINEWGCFITDVAMIFQYFGIQKMPDGSALTPGAINTWLKSQKDGYLGGGNVNPLALQNLSRLIKLAFNNPGFTADALEYKFSSGSNANIVAVNLLNNIPSILQEPGHYVVATGKTGSTFFINDPFYNRTLLTDGYNNTFSMSQRYVPSHTDLSYILLVGPQNVAFTVTDASGSAVGEEFTQQPLQNPNNPSQTNGPAIKMFFLQQPDSASYTLNITSNTPYSAKAYLYDQLGNVQITDLKGSGTLTNPDVFTVSFTKTDSHHDSVKKISIFDQLTNDINLFYQQNLLKKENYKELLEEVNEAKNQYNKQHFLQEKIGLAELLIKLIIWNNNHNLSNTVYQTLVADVTFLLTH